MPLIKTLIDMAKSLCPPAACNCGALRQRIDSPVTEECCGL